jgi:hypothetical protein
MFVNAHILATTEISSAALGVLGSAIHPIHGAAQTEEGFKGTTLGVVYQDGEKVGSFAVESTDDNATLQVMVDLTSIKGPKSPTFKINSKGHLIFYVPLGEGGFRVTLEQTEKKKQVIVFDNAYGLQQYDFFTVSLVRPGAYEIRNKVPDITQTIRLEYPARSEKPEEEHPPVFVDTYDDSFKFEVDGGPFDPSKDMLKTGQGLVFRIQSHTDLVISLLEEEAYNENTSSGKKTTESGKKIYRSIRKYNPYRAEESDSPKTGD